MAPSAPITMMGPRSSLPWAAMVDAAFSVVSPGKIGITPSRATRRNTHRYDNRGFSGFSMEMPSPVST